MNWENLMDAIGQLPEDMIAAAAEKRMKKKYRWAPLCAIAACLCLLLTLPLALGGGLQASNKAEAPMEMAPADMELYQDHYYAGSANGSDELKASTEHFLATVVEVHERYLLVEPLEDEWEHGSSNRIQVPIPNPQDPQAFTPGDLLRIYYSGTLLESYPAQAAGVIGIERLG